jgi:hypothetical protein
MAVVAAVAVLGACGTDDPGARIAIDDLPHALAAALCNNIGPCCERAGFPHDAAKCVIEAEKGLEVGVTQNRMAGISYDGVAARACVDAYVDAGRTCGDNSEINRQCRKVFTGTLGPGETCDDSQECAARGYCQRTAGAPTGKCVDGTLLHGKIGDACGESCTHYDLQEVTACSGLSASVPTQCYSNDGLYCNDAHVCAAVPTIDQPCVASAKCGGNTFCDTTVNVCASKRTSGSCGDFNDACAAEATCNFGTRECELRKASGAACSGLYDECQTTDACIQGTCQTRTIASPLTCFDGTMMMLPFPGELPLPD